MASPPNMRDKVNSPRGSAEGRDQAGIAPEQDRRQSAPPPGAARQLAHRALTAPPAGRRFGSSLVRVRRLARRAPNHSVRPALPPILSRAGRSIRARMRAMPAARDRLSRAYSRELQRDRRHTAFAGSPGPSDARPGREVLHGAIQADLAGGRPHSGAGPAGTRRASGAGSVGRSAPRLHGGDSRRVDQVQPRAPRCRHPRQCPAGQRQSPRQVVTGATTPEFYRPQIAIVV